jgi:hypothetical protein
MNENDQPLKSTDQWLGAKTKIDKNVPIPPLHRHTNLLESMQVTDSVLVTSKQAAYLRLQAKKLGLEVTSRRESKKIRVWRTK